jgi:transposase
MKTITTVPTPHTATDINPSPVPDKSVVRQVFTLGLDVDLRFVVTAIQCDQGVILPARKYTRTQLVAWVQEKVQAGHTVRTVYECCGFGYTLHEQLTAAGAHSLLTTPMRLSLERRRKNDRLDARELCVRLSRYHAGQRHELRPIRLPSRAEVQRRELGRQREFWKREVRRLENHGRALRIEHEHETLPGGWAGPRKWKALAKACSAFVRQQLEPVAQHIRSLKAELDRLTEELEALVAQEKIPHGLGALTVSLLDGEVCDWQRFRHRKAVGSYTGCCPSEHSSGGVQRFGGIDRHGNARVRVLLVEAVWRLLKWQPGWHARQKWLAKLQHGASLKKKSAVALARQLAIDLWRWRTGRATAAELGWVLKPAAVEPPTE